MKLEFEKCDLCFFVFGLEEEEVEYPTPNYSGHIHIDIDEYVYIAACRILYKESNSMTVLQSVST